MACWAVGPPFKHRLPFWMALQWALVGPRCGGDGWGMRPRSPVDARGSTAATYPGTGGWEDGGRGGRNARKRKEPPTKTGAGTAEDRRADTARRQPPLPLPRRARQASTMKEHARPAAVRTTPAEAMKVRAMPTCTTHSEGVIGPHARGGVGRRVAESGQHAEAGGRNGPWRRGEACGGRPGRGGGVGSKRTNDPRDNQHNPQCANYWAPLMRKRHQREHRPQRPTERSDPTQHAKGRPGDCPGPRKETTTRRNVTRGGGDCLQALKSRSRGIETGPQGGGVGTRPQYLSVCLWRRLLASHHCSF